MASSRTRIAAVVAGTAALAAVGIGAAQSDTRGVHAQRLGAVSPAASLAFSAGATTKTVAATSDFNDVSNSSTTLSQLPGMATRITVAAGKRALLTARFTAETNCSGGGAQPNWCVAEILVDGVEMAPGDGTDYAIDSTGFGTKTSADWQGHALERVALVGAGTHVITVVGGVTDFGVTRAQTFWTGERTLVVNAANA